MKNYRSIAIALLLTISSVNFAADLDSAPINYSSAPANNAISALVEKLRKGKATLEYQNETGYLLSLLKQLDVPLSSQVLVFSKTSLQRRRISPKTPRALYFNDELTIGFCKQGDVLEVAAADANLGTVFYTLEQNAEKKPRFTRETENCLLCHGSSANQGFPGHLVRSVMTDRNGEMLLSKGTRRIDHSTPFEQRWGGWYVTGTSGKQRHLGNHWLVGRDSDEAKGSNVTDLKPYFTVADYPTTHSDLVALMVMEHQGELQNRMTRANFQTRLALHEQAALNKAFDRPATERSEGITRRIHWACEPVVEYLLFSEETPLNDAVAGTTDFAKEFTARGPFDAKKRSLREFDLKKRLFRYPMSYQIYSKQFDGLPSEAKERIYLRLWEVLTGKDRTKPFAHLSDADRTSILEILRETKADLPVSWKK